MDSTQTIFLAFTDNQSAVGDYYRALATVRRDLVELLSEHQLLQFAQNVPYVEVVREIANGH